ncbi:phosphoadenosine phosphosulfate reductase [Sulfitobacter sp. F26169L]|uniref:phosphoadenosine phosphosulfate reductase n=1 Tax=Sulfitobacter sp. F26169L TaxID=2996015 RepID=UPI002260FD60|nr:phosphoadenosine phosphosulfate reductase [Sulfitobacter sp. F26169L]MCX7566203.1 phosphoadenosine phosphosulfate reductase [Sulfitobacter sp. F26169L]
MADESLNFTTSLAGMKKADWLAAVEELCEEDGYFERLGKRHYAAFIEKSATLLVTFETLQGIPALSSLAQPLGWEMMLAHDWSSLCIASNGDTWFRDKSVYGYFDRLIDDGFFDEFEQVIFYGAGPCGYAAAAYSVASPEARVLAVQPQATLDPRITEWDDRFTDMRRMDFTSRYGYAPDMLDGATAAYVVYDPREQLDAMHAALFTRPNTRKLRLRHMGDAIQTDLLEMEQLAPLLLAIMDDTLDDLGFARMMRSRRMHPPYLRNLLAALDKDGRESLALALARNVTARMHAPRFARRLAEAKQTNTEDD